MPTSSPTPTPFLDGNQIATDTFSMLFDQIKVMWPIFALLIVFGLLNAMINRKNAQEKEKRRRERVYNDERRRERARQDERRDRRDRDR